MSDWRDAPWRRLRACLPASPSPPADVLLASSTVREALLIAALLKLPRSMPTAEKVAQVDAVLADLVGCVLPAGWVACCRLAAYGWPERSRLTDIDCKGGDGAVGIGAQRATSGLPPAERLCFAPTLICTIFHSSTCRLLLLTLSPLVYARNWSAASTRSSATRCWA